MGASTRAAAQSAIRAGYQPWCADLFADTDLRAIVPDARRCPADQYPNGLADLIREAPHAPWIYTGGLENHPRLIGKMMHLRPLRGNGPAVLRLCRNPFRVQDVLRKAGLPALRVVAGTEKPPGDCRWLCKPLRGSAGQRIDFADRGIRRSRTHYFQEFMDGIAMSAVFARSERTVTLVGVTEQLVGIEWLNAPPFRYCGSVGPVDAADPLRGCLLRIATTLGDCFDLMGLFGVDFMLHSGQPWVVEINPRYPASVEVLELATGIAALALHRAAFEPVMRPAPTVESSQRCVGKAIVYAPHRLVMPELGTRWSRDIRHLDPPSSDPAVVLADIPATGEVVEQGWPILSILAAAPTRDACMTYLQSAAKQLVNHAASRIGGDSQISPSGSS